MLRINPGENGFEVMLQGVPRDFANLGDANVCLDTAQEERTVVEFRGEVDNDLQTPLQERLDDAAQKEADQTTEVRVHYGEITDLHSGTVLAIDGLRKRIAEDGHRFEGGEEQHRRLGEFVLLRDTLARHKRKS